MKSISNSFQKRLTSIFKSHSRLWMGLYVITVSAVIMIFWKNWVYDDPFITYRYANNLAHGIGFVYNPGERVLSTTTPLFTLLLAGIALFWKNIPLAANLVGAISIAVGAAFFFDIAKSQKSLIVGWVALILFPSCFMVLTTISSETPLYLAFTFAAFAFFFRRNYPITAVFSALVLLIRPDGVLVPAILVVDFLLRKGKPIPWKAVVIFLILVVPWFIFSWFYFGSPIPSTLFTKQNQGILLASRSFTFGIFRTLEAQLAHWYNWLGLSLAGIGFIYSFLFPRKWLVFIAWPILYSISYTLLRVATYFWYYAPLIPGYVALLGLGLTAILEALEHIRDQIDARSELLYFFPAIIIALSISILAAAQITTSIRVSKKIDPRYLIYREVGLWLSKNTQPDAKIGVLEVGIIGYFSQRPIIDFAGLIQPEVAQQMVQSETYDDTALYAIHCYQPQFLVLSNNLLPELEAALASIPCITKNQFKGSEFDSNVDITVYACQYP